MITLLLLSFYKINFFMESTNKQYDILRMILAKSYIETLPSHQQNTDYKNIINMITDYLHTHCQHNIVTDLIDIDPDRSETIRYCDKCECTFT